jgi:hypothetical protein
MQDVLRLLADPPIPFTNSPTERDGRMRAPRRGLKLRHKIPGDFRSKDGTKDFAGDPPIISSGSRPG